MSAWVGELTALGQNGDDAVLVTVTGVRGSAPREAGTRMIVTRRESIGTIGGGALEYECTRIACEQLADAAGPLTNTAPRRFVLGANCGQCCGGVVDVQFEVVTPGAAWLSALQRQADSAEPAVLATALDDASRKHIVTAAGCESVGSDAACPSVVLAAAQQLVRNGGCAQVCEGYLLAPVRPCEFNTAVFGAGHVGTQVVNLLARLDCQIRWIDSRQRIFPERTPDNVLAVETREPAREVAAMPAGSFFLVLTHSHPLDLDVTASILARGDFAYCGLIGSASKRRRFEKQFRKQGLGDAVIEKLTCPIGVPGISSKRPAEIAFAVVAEILQFRDAALPATVTSAPALRPVG